MSRNQERRRYFDVSNPIFLVCVACGLAVPAINLKDGFSGLSDLLVNSLIYLQPPLFFGLHVDRRLKAAAAFVFAWLLWIASPSLIATLTPGPPLTGMDVKNLYGLWLPYWLFCVVAGLINAGALLVMVTEHFRGPGTREGE